MLSLTSTANFRESTAEPRGVVKISPQGLHKEPRHSRSSRKCWEHSFTRGSCGGLRTRPTQQASPGRMGTLVTRSPMAAVQTWFYCRHLGQILPSLFLCFLDQRTPFLSPACALMGGFLPCPLSQPCQRKNRTNSQRLAEAKKQRKTKRRRRMLAQLTAVRGVAHTFLLPSQNPPEAGASISFILQMREPRLREVEEFVQGHTD